MRKEVVNFGTCEIEDKIMYDIFVSTKCFQDTDLDKTIGIYGYENLGFLDEEVEKRLKILQEFNYIYHYKNLTLEKAELKANICGNVVVFNMSKYVEMYTYSTSIKIDTKTGNDIIAPKGTKNKRIPKFMFMVNPDKWKYLQYVRQKYVLKNKLEKNCFFRKEQEKQVLSKGLKKIEQNKELLENFSGILESDDYKHILNLEKITEEDKKAYIEDMINFFYYKYPNLITFFEKDLKIIRFIKVENNQVMGFDGEKRNNLFSLSDKEKKLYKVLLDMPLLKKQLFLLTNEKSEHTFKKTLTRLREKIKNAEIEHLFSIKCEKQTYTLYFNKEK